MGMGGGVDGGCLRYSCPQLEGVATWRKTRDVAVELELLLIPWVRVN